MELARQNGGDRRPGRPDSCSRSRRRRGRREPPPLEPQGAAVPDGLADVLGHDEAPAGATRRTTRTKMRPASCTTSGADGAPGEDEEETGDELLTDAGRGWRR